jgi:hypothetical protein
LLYIDDKDNAFIQALQKRLGVNINWTGTDLEKAMKSDLDANCMKYIGDIMARTIYDSIDDQFSQEMPQFNVIIGKTTYLYAITYIVSTTVIDYDQIQETGHVVTTLTSAVELTSEKTKLKETVRFVVILIL